MEYAKSNLCQLGWISCFGCCGHGFKEKKDIAKSITKNTLEFHNHKKTDLHIVDWLNRSKDRRKSGICKNLVFDHKTEDIVCPGHPEQNKGKDHRLEHNYCDVLHLCKTAFFYDLWESERQEAFIKFLKNKKKQGKIDWHSYSLGMTSDELLEEFEGLKWN